MTQWLIFMLNEVELFLTLYFAGASCIVSPDQSIIRGKI